MTSLPRTSARGRGIGLPRAGWVRSSWIRFVGMRLLGSMTSAFVLVIGTFFLLLLIPGDPAVANAGSEASSADIAATREALGLDAPLQERLLALLGSLASGDLGTSWASGRPVSEVIGTRLGLTLTIALVSAAFVVCIALPLGTSVGIATSEGERPRLGRAFSVATGLVSTIPGYVLATGLVVVAALGLGWFPPAYSERQGLWSLVLPVVALTVAPIAAISRVVHRETHVVLRQEYVRTARSWQVSRARLAFRYVVPNVAASTLTLCGALLAGLVGGSVIIENVFAVPGLGTALVSALLQRDQPTIQGIVLVLGLLTAAILLAVDVMLAAIDPRRIRGDVVT